MRKGLADGSAAARARPAWRRASPSYSEWESLSSEIRRCQLCPLGRTRTHAVVYRGGLSPRIVFVGEAPGREEDLRGIPFVGRSGRRLDAAIACLGLGEKEFGVLNVLKCRPPHNRFNAAAARTCRPYLDRQLDLLRPQVLVPLGRTALRAIAPNAPPVLKAAGRPLRSSDGRILFPLLHPAAALRSRRWAERWDRDIAALHDWLAAGSEKNHTVGRSR